VSNLKGTSIKAKAQAQTASIEETQIDFNDQLTIDPELIKEMEAQKLAYRWINGSKFKENYGFDKRRWQPYKRPKSEGLENKSFGYADSEGFIRRGDLILAVRPIAIHEQYKRNLAERNQRLAGNQQKRVTEELKQVLRDGGMAGKSEVYDGYEEND
jgi:hypothetical protein